MKTSKGILVMALMAIFIASGFAYAQQEVLKLEHQAFGKRQRPGVTFPHAKHFESIDCLQCHHFYADGKNVWDESRETNCSACHALKAEQKKMELMNAFHGTCLTCHRKDKAAGKKSGPVMCGECHVKPGP